MDSAGQTYLVIYIAVSVGLTLALARILFTNGTPFLLDVFPDQPQLARAVNRLLVTGFYMLNLGYALFIVKTSAFLYGFQAFQFLVNRLALLLITLAGIHFVNVFVFWRIRVHHERREMVRPMVAPTAASGQVAGQDPGFVFREPGEEDETT